MNLQAKRISGSSFSAEDKLEVLLNYDKSIEYAFISHTIEMVSGPRVTHGGGAEAEEYLNYKELSDDDNTVVDYSSTEMSVLQEEQGVSVIKVKVECILQSEVDAYTTAYEAWVNEPESDSKSELGPEFPNSIILTTGDITLEFQDDTFV